MADIYYTLSDQSAGKYTEKMSRFLSFAIPVSSAAEAKQTISKYQNEYHDARHVCWAYMIGPKRAEYLSSDNGEPSGTAGKPILGQINSYNLTDILIIVVRYFGGIKLGTSGLIQAYREAAKLAIEAGNIVECHEKAKISFEFSYMSMNDVMKIIKSPKVKVLDQCFDNLCSIDLETNLDDADEIIGRLKGLVQFRL